MIKRGLYTATNEYFNFFGNTNFIPIWTTLITNLILFFKVKKTIVRDFVLFLERTDFDFFLFCDREHDGERFFSTVNPINIWLQQEHLGLYRKSETWWHISAMSLSTVCNPVLFIFYYVIILMKLAFGRRYNRFPRQT